LANLRKYVNTIAAHETQQLQLADERRRDVAAASEILTVTQGEVESARARVLDIETSFEVLADSYEAKDHALAASELFRAEKRHAGAAKRLAAAKQLDISTDTDVAVVVAQVLRSAYPNVQVHPTFVRDAGPPPPEGDRPIMLVRQFQRTDLLSDGAVRGSVELTYYRSTIHHQLSVSRIEDTAEALGVGLRIVGAVSSNIEDDEARVKVEFAYPELPSLPSIAADAPKMVARKLAGSVADHARSHGEAPRVDRETGAYVTPYVVALPDQATVVSEEIDDAGQRTLVVEGSALIRVDKGTATPLSSHIDNAVEDLVRTRVMGGLGTVVSVERVGDSDLRADSEDATARLSLVNPDGLPQEASGIRFNTVQQVVIRMTFQSKTEVAA
jgi:hypothetical protein